MMENILLANYSGKTLEAGVDEAGRGCLAGPVYAAAVILPLDFTHPFLNDSKQLSEKQREELRPIIEKEAIAFAVRSVGHKEIDKINILNAAIKAMHLALKDLSSLPEHIIVDGNRFKPFQKIPATTIIEGDAKYLSIAAASVLAKTYRDEHMLKLHKKFPHYCWNSNKGYATLKHREAIEEHGPCDHHRMSFTLTKNQMSFDFE
jgi:ribonuclease HII